MEPVLHSSNAAPRRHPMDRHDETTCRVRDVLNRIGDKWSLTVIHELAWGSKRFTGLLRDVSGISQRMLTVTLRALERDGLVSRTVHATVPPRVDYQLTDLGRTLLDTICQLMAWTVDHLEDIEQARRRYDVRSAARQQPSPPAVSSEQNAGSPGSARAPTDAS